MTHEDQDSYEKIIAEMRDLAYVATRACIGDWADRLVALNRAQGWQKIETAPKDVTEVLLCCPERGVVRGRWNDCRYDKNPRPYWTHDRERLWGTIACRKDQPTHWMPLPAALNKEEGQ